MAEGRLLKKNISHSRRLAELKTDSARMLWLMMLPHLDIKGRLHAAPEMIKGNVVPRLKHLSEDKVEALLQDLHRVGLVFIYQADGDTYLQFRKFEVFQNLRPGKEAESRIPAPDPEALRKHFEENSGTTPGELPEQSRSNTGELRGKIREDKIREDKIITLHPSPFDQFWHTYPKKVGKQATLKAWNRANGKRPPIDKILQALEAQKQSEQWTRDGGQYIPNPATWINQGRWDDELKVELEDEWARLKREALEKDRLEAERRKTQ